MNAILSLTDHHAVIKLIGDFTFEGHRPFKEATQQLLASDGVETLSIDFEAVEYMDSAALGMLLLLRERLGDKPIHLAQTRGTVRAVLDVANFGRLFTLD
ncbi:STAS domain-containing protein [Chitinimonas koreensis]|uniref:STAS domain-containing protein n=1 Tax=Chitinimonas koreensis TaxID=356302 RepID=UPI000429242C|nr:STAS domain-containing protein [Chitinimonas koreensis]QNM96940.1 STAS domain-containing protein [Chitinimonas koreensis]